MGSDADVIYDNMQIGSGRKGGVSSFEDVKYAFEQTYNCLGITCDDVGGIIDKRSGGYYEETEPCNSKRSHTSGESRPSRVSPSNNSQQKSSSNVGVIIGVLVAIAAFAGGAMLMFQDKFGNQKEFEGKASDLELNQDSDVAAQGSGYQDNEEGGQDEIGTSSRSVASRSIASEDSAGLSNVTLT